VAALAADLAPLSGDPGGRSASMIAALGTAPPSRRAPTAPVSGKATTLQTAAAQSTGGPIPTAGVQAVAAASRSAASPSSPSPQRLRLFAFGRTSSPAPEPPRPPLVAPVSDASLPAPPVPSPPPATDAAVESVADAAGSASEIRTKLRALAASHDWYAVLQLADLDRDDPEIAGVVHDAKRQYVAQQARAIDAQVKQGQCARARELAAEAHQVVPDEPSLEARARACKPRVAPAPPSPPPPPAPTTLDAATQAFQRGEFTAPWTSPSGCSEADPRSSAALRIAALSACSAKNVDKAAQYAARLPAKERAEAPRSMRSQQHRARR